MLALKGRPEESPGGSGALESDRLYAKGYSKISELYLHVKREFYILSYMN